VGIIEVCYDSLPADRTQADRRVTASARPRVLATNKIDFWNTEEPETWSAEEIEELISDSPWARPVTGEVITQQSGCGGSTGGRRHGGTRSSGGAVDLNATSPKFPGSVRWVSAKPILLALKIKLPADFAEFHVIGVSGLPVISGHSSGDADGDSFEALKELTTLQTKGSDAIQPGLIRSDPNDTSTVLFGFYNKFIDLSKAKNATFFTTMGPVKVKVKFDLSHMLYRGELAV
jgi:hypothetical protein